jgi:lysyl-tRNA synthetase class 2
MLQQSSRNLEVLRDRAAQFEKVRRFFADRNVLEVDCPSLTTGAPVDLHIDLFKVLDAPHHSRYLHSSPEYCMKRLLAEGLGDIYQLGHVFRQGEVGRLHNPEFMMAEWYRVGFSFQQMMEETAEFIKLFIGEMPVEVISYREAISKYVGIDYVKASETDLLEILNLKNVPVYAGIEKEGRDALLNLILAELVEPKLGKGVITLLAFYPSTQAALACIVQNGDEAVAERFEIYVDGVELANGYHELGDSSEQRERFHQANQQRIEHGKDSLPIDEFFLKALKNGIPDCCGVAVGVDRLMMLRHQTTTLSSVIPFDWTYC